MRANCTYFARRAPLFFLVAALVGCSSSQSSSGGSSAVTQPDCGGADLTSDPANCGACGNDCGGGTCSAGVCGPITLVSAQKNPGELRIVGADLWWGARGTGASDASLVHCSPASCDSPTVVASGMRDVTSFDLSSTRLFATDGQPVVWGMGLDGSNPVTEVDFNLGVGSDGNPARVVVGGSYIYFLTTDTTPTGFVAACPTNGGCGTSLGVVADSQTLTADLEVDAKSAYWSSTGTSALLTTPLVVHPYGDIIPTPTTLAQGQVGITAITIDADHVYWGTGVAGKTNYVRSIAKTGGAVTDLATMTGAIGDLTVDANTVYWTERESGNVQSVPKTGGTPTLLASGRTTPLGIAVDATSIYWADAATGKTADGLILKIAKPNAN